eukprot:1189364-Prorocentrum_minimum.AAC.5
MVPLVVRPGACRYFLRAVECYNRSTGVDSLVPRAGAGVVCSAVTTGAGVVCGAVPAGGDPPPGPPPDPLSKTFAQALESFVVRCPRE